MNKETAYRTVERVSEGFYREKGSTFTAYAFPIKNEEEIRKALDGLKRRYHDARHICYAYVLGQNGEVYKAHDAGEPSYTAGEPILRQIRTKNLSFVLIAVVRYFGGTKLGTGGLMQAYKWAAAEALERNTLVPIVSFVRIAVTVSPKDLGAVTDLFLKAGGTIREQSFEETYLVLFEISSEKATAVYEKLRRMNVTFKSS